MDYWRLRRRGNSAQPRKSQIIARNTASNHKDDPYMGSPSGYELGPHVSKDGAIVTALASHLCDLFSSPSINFICGLSLLWFFPLLREVFVQVLRLSPPTVPNSNSIWNARRRLNLEFLRTPNFVVGEQIRFYKFLHLWETTVITTAPSLPRIKHLQDL